MPTLTIDGAEHPLEGECILGRHRSCAIQVKDEAASRQHAKVFSADGLWWVEDLGSANGTNLNGTAVAGRKRLRDKDAISIGKTVIRFAEGVEAATGAVAAGKRVAPTNGRDVTGLAGSRIAGYRIDRYLGRGMLGAVYQGHQLNLDRAVAFKVFDPERCVRDAGLAKRFLVEAGKVGSVTHDGLVQLHESGEHEGLLWCSMEWVEGDTLETRLKNDGRIEPALAFLIVEKIAEALSAAHTQGVIHGDLRPSHVIVMGDGRIRLTDVGMMGIFEEAELPSSGAATLAWYLSPEEAAEGASDPRSDIYSLGCLLYHLLAGKPPFDGADTGAVIAAHAKQPIPSLKGTGAKVDIAAVDALIQGMLAKNPGWRHASMDEVIAEIRPLRETAAGRPADEAPRPILRRSSEIHAPSARVVANRHPVRTALLWVLAVVVLCLIAALTLPHLKQAAVPEPVAYVPPAPVVDVRPTTRPAPVAQPPVPMPIVPVAVNGESPTAAAWKQVQAAVDQAQRQNEWSNAEQALAAFAPQAKADPAVARAVADRQQQLAGDGDQWYQDELAKVAKGDAPTDIAERLRGIDRMRDVVLADNRPDAESRYQEALTRLGQRLNVAKRQARQAIETGRVLDLPKIASDLAPAFAQTPVTDLHRQFSLLCNEAAGIKPVWATSWAVTKPKLLAAKGADALAAAAALLLAGDTAEAKALLANDPALANGELLRRREAIFGRKAAVLTFDDPDDLQYIEVVAGEPRMAAGSLTAAPGEAVVLSCSAPIGAAGWDVAVGLALEQARADGQAAVSLAHGENADVQVRIEKDAVHARVRTAGGWQETRAPRPETKVLRLRLAERGGTVTVFLNDQAVLTVPQAKVAAGSVLRFESTGMVWGMTDLQVVGGE